ncbi:16716_t:CDS:2, partial [Entrophospora sp. SA101]
MITCCDLALYIAIGAFAVILALLAMFFNYNLKLKDKSVELSQRTSELEKKNGHEQQQINQLKIQLKRSQSADDIVTATSPTIPLQKSHSQLELPSNQPTPTEQITQLKQTLTFTQNTAQNYLKNLQLAQAKITELEEELANKETFTEAPEENISELKVQIQQLEDQILELRLEKIKDFGDYYQTKQELETELELNINEGISEIKRLENKLLATNKKKLELAQQLGTSHSQVANLELQLLAKQETNP